MSTMTVVESIAELTLIQNPAEGQTALVKSFYANNLGVGGTFIYESASSSINNGGTIFNGWKRLYDSELIIEFWGVVNDGSDQSLKIQKALDYCFEKNINYLSSLGNANILINNTLIFNPLVITNQPWGYGGRQFIFDLKGSYLTTSNDDLTFIKILRDHIRIINAGIFGTYGKQQRGIVYGYDLGETHISGTRESVMWCGVDNLKLGGLDIGIQFNPNYGGYGMYYHKFENIDARDVKILIYGEHTTSTQDDINANRGANKITRTEFNNITHVGGACTVFAKDIETTSFNRLNVEFITAADSRLPDGKAVCIYIPKAQAYNPFAYDNSGLRFTGAFEVVGRIYNFQQPLQPVLWGVFTIAGQDSLNLKIGSEWVVPDNNLGNSYFNSTLNKNNYVGSIEANPVTMLTNKTDDISKSSYPNPDVDFWGTLINISMTSDQSPETLQLLGSAAEQLLRMRFNSNGQWSTWEEFLTSKNSYGLGKSWKTLANSNLNDFKFAGGGLRIAQLTFDDLNSDAMTSYPIQNQQFYGALAWLSTTHIESTEGMQVMFSVLPLNLYYRSYTQDNWSSWRTVATV